MMNNYKDLAYSIKSMKIQDISNKITNKIK